MHLRGAGIGETDVDPARDQGPHQTFRTVHSLAPVRGLKHLTGQINHSFYAVRQRGPEGAVEVLGAWLPSPVHAKRNFNRTI
jgi:hypothetical protein